MSLEVPLSEIRPAFQGVIPSPLATVSADGVPNSTYLSIVWYVDDERISLSNQFFGKTTANLRENPHAVLRVVDPTTMTEYELDLTWLRSESSGEVFDAMRLQLDAVAAQSGQEEVFRLRAIELLRVDRCVPAGVPAIEASSEAPVGEVLSGLETFVRRLGESRDLAEATRTALQALDDLFGFRRSILFMVSPEQDHLFVVAANGFQGTIGAEVAIGEGVIGVAAMRRRQVRLGDLDRLTRATADVEPSPRERPDVPSSGLPDAQSMLVSPLLLHDQLIGVLYLDSQDAGRFTVDDARLLDVVSAHLAVTIALHDDDGPAPDEPVLEGSSAPEREETTVALYDHDGTVLVDGTYVIRGVPGRILFAMLEEHHASGRSEFSNREIRLDRRIGLPAGKDNLEARLLALRRRLEERDDPFRVERIGRGQLRLSVEAPLRLERHDE